MALIDEYKQAIKDVLDGRAPEAPRPSELPWTEDKLANFWAAAASLDMALAAQPKKFLVTLTPTATDFSGTMDKTVAEINAAYEAGMEIVFRVITSESSHMDVACSAQWFVDEHPYPSFNAYIVDNRNNVILFAFTGVSDDGTDNTYACLVYSLTRAS